MTTIALRLRPGQFLKEEIEALTKERAVRAGVVLSMVGSVDRAVLRLAGATPAEQSEKTWSEPLEIVSATGTVSPDGCHLHASFSDRQGYVFGGHLKNGCRVQTTCEIVIGVLNDTQFSRTLDPTTGFKELTIS